MKQWNKPEMKVFSVRMNENIAASGGSTYDQVKLYVTENGIITREAGYYNCVGTQIQDTSVHYNRSSTPYFWESERNTIVGCQA